ncbi:MAG: hypothetical protein A2271_02000 [Candidatus Moranbacteria bacterium RIFOXYA12_FULL_35_19]|nr:MAG: hypothetical protein UR78_C0029G0002 [Candidatus Moranbacteria bacterium GW2011_GWF2_35_39]OGI33170.1 MAG: hypothetical protein A2489_01485 [Candidatus Moranbacteria bacterium RIFOXYC12_FULL_36_13]OGI36101.1 MAG: hypothetical protein A2271_02000 [Candidatus Moranbacteria bacterium RIFOXYA12_FULL_35_19]
MAKDTKAKPEEKKEEKATPQAKPKERNFLSILKSEILDNVLLGILLFLGVKHQSDSNIGGGGREKQAPDWILSAFPGLTRDDDNEYGIIINSHRENSDATETKIVAKEFHSNIVSEGIYDGVKYIVNLVKLRREFTERTKNPLPEDKSGGRISYERIVINDPALAFISELLKEKNDGGTAEEIFERQKKRADEINLLQKKHLLKRSSEWFQKNKLLVPIYALSATFIIIYIFSIIFE